MQNTGSWKPLREDREEPIPCGATLTAAAENEPPQSPHSLPEDTQPVDVSRDRMVTVIAVHNLSQPCTDVGHRLVHSEAQFCFNPSGSGDVTLSKTLERLKAFCRAAFLRKWIDDNPALTLRGPKAKPRPTLPFTDDEMTRILAAIEKYRDKSRKTGQANALRLRAFVLVLRYSGMRLGDVASLSTDRLIGNKIQLYTQKTGSARVLRAPAVRRGPSGMPPEN